MPHGKTHERLNIGATLTVSMALVVFDPILALGVGAGLGVSCLITPDITDTENSRPEWRLRQLGFVGSSYAWLFDVVSARIPHRHYISHSPIGTLFRMGLLVWLPVLVWFLGWKVFLGFLAGWFLGDMIHVLADVGVSSYKRLRRRLRREKRGRPAGRRRAREDLGQWW